MKAIINLYNRDYPWCKDFFVEKSLCSLPLAGKEFAEYLIDQLSEIGVSEILLLDYDFDQTFQKQLGNGERWSVNLTYQGSGIRKSLHTLLLEHQKFTEEDDTLWILFGPILPEYLLYPFSEDRLEELPDDRTSDSGVYLRRDGHLFRCKFPVCEVLNLQDYFELNFKILNDPQDYVLPGYHTENAVYTGMNAMIMNDCEIKPPVMLGDNICLERECRLKGNVIIGHDVIVDRGNELKDCIVFDHTYIGKDMEFVNKIVTKGRIIDPYANALIELDELGITAPLKNYANDLDCAIIVEYLSAAFMALFFLIPYLLLLPFHGMLKNTLLRCKLSLDLYPQLWSVLIGQKRLIARGERQECAVIHYSDSISWEKDKIQQGLDDCYFRHHRTVLLTIKTICKTWIKRFFVTNEFLKNT